MKSRCPATPARMQRSFAKAASRRPSLGAARRRSAIYLGASAFASPSKASATPTFASAHSICEPLPEGLTMIHRLMRVAALLWVAIVSLHAAEAPSSSPRGALAPVLQPFVDRQGIAGAVGLGGHKDKVLA